MNEWGIALVGFMGAIIGAVVSFVGLIWQRNVQRNYDIRQRCAEMIVAGETIHDTYVQSTGLLPLSSVSGFLELLNAKSTEMTLVQRYLELVAKYKIEGPANRYWMASFEYVTIAEKRFKYHQKPSHEALVEAHNAWRSSRDELISALNRHKRPHWWQVGRKIKATWTRVSTRRASRRMIKELTRV